MVLEDQTFESFTYTSSLRRVNSMSILRFLKLIDGIPFLNGQLLSLVPSAAIRGMNQKVR